MGLRKARSLRLRLRKARSLRLRKARSLRLAKGVEKISSTTTRGCLTDSKGWKKLRDFQQ
jgi:hypothetical protein